MVSGSGRKSHTDGSFRTSVELIVVTGLPIGVRLEIYRMELLSTSYEGRFPLFTWDQLKKLPEVEWLIEGFLPKPGIVVLYGQPGSGKTFAALGMALAVANEQETCMEMHVHSTDVLYIAAEGAHGLKSRVRAYEVCHGGIENKVRFLTEAPNLLDNTALDELLCALNEQSFRPGLIVIDTLARVVPGADENSAQDMGRLVAALDTLKTEFGAVVMVVHHTVKNTNEERGSSALRGAADLMILCTKVTTSSGPGVKLTCKKMKEAEEFEPVTAALNRVDFDDGGSSLTLGERTSADASATTLAGMEILNLFEMFGEQGATNTELFNEFSAKGLGSKSTFNRALKALKAQNLVGLKGSGKGARYFAGKYDG